jgi:hypothetical protein
VRGRCNNRKVKIAVADQADAHLPDGAKPVPNGKLRSARYDGILLQQVTPPVAHGASTPGSRLGGSGSLLAE